MSDPESVRALFARTREAFGRGDLLFNNAGVNAPGIPLEELSYEQWKYLPLDANVQFMTVMVTKMPFVGRG